jgi:metallo-beta-lactamase family protein
MLTGGRMLTYLQKFISKESTTIMLTGYQAEGTRGRDLLEEIRSIKIRGKYYEVRAQIKNLSQFSGHGDQSELIDWLSELESPPQNCFLIHGEPSSSKALKELLESKKQWSSIAIPSLNEEIHLK